MEEVSATEGEIPDGVKTQKCSMSDLEGGWFRKGERCASCASREKCTEDKNHVKTFTRRMWEEYMEMTEDIRHPFGNKEIYGLRRETIEWIFRTVKDLYGSRYAQYIGKARIEMKAGLTFTKIEKRCWL